MHLQTEWIEIIIYNATEFRNSARATDNNIFNQFTLIHALAFGISFSNFAKKNHNKINKHKAIDAMMQKNVRISVPIVLFPDVGEKGIQLIKS